MDKSLGDGILPMTEERKEAMDHINTTESLLMTPDEANIPLGMPVNRNLLTSLTIQKPQHKRQSSSIHTIEQVVAQGVK